MWGRDLVGEHCLPKITVTEFHISHGPNGVGPQTQHMKEMVPSMGETAAAKSN